MYLRNAIATKPSLLAQLFMGFADFIWVLSDYMFLLYALLFSFVKFCFDVVVIVPLILAEILSMSLRVLFENNFVRNNLIRLVVALEVGYLFYKAALFGYFKYYNKDREAEALKKEMISEANSWWQYLKKNSGKIAKQILVGMAVNIVVFVTLWPLLDALDYVLFRSTKANSSFDNDEYDYEDYDLDEMDTAEDFRDMVIYTPISEEIVFRGIVMNFMKRIFETIVPYFVSSEPEVPQQTTSNNNLAEPAIYSIDNRAQPKDKQKTKSERLVDNLSNFSTAVIFSAGHSPRRRPTAFVGGLISGFLTQYYDGSLVAPIAEHMTNNALACADMLARRVRP